MGEPASIFDMEDAEVEERALLEAEAELEAGKGVDHADVSVWLEELAKGRRLPPPPCR